MITKRLIRRANWLIQEMSRRKKYKSVDDYERDRANQNFDETEEEIEYRKRQAYLEKEKERERRKRLVARSFGRKTFQVNRLMLSS